MDKVPKKKIVSVNFSCAVFSLFDFLTLEDGTDRLSQNVLKDLPFYTVYLRRTEISCDDLIMQTLVWLCMVLDPVWCFICKFKMTSHI